METKVSVQEGVIESAWMERSPGSVDERANAKPLLMSGNLLVIFNNTKENLRQAGVKLLTLLVFLFTTLLTVPFLH